MISNWLSATLAQRNIHYGWVMVGVTFLTALISAGTVGAPGVFIVPLQKEFGWSSAEISSALSIRFILFGLMAPFAAALLNRYGLRNMTLLSLLIVASALVVSLFMTQVWHLMLLWGVVIGLGTGMTALVLGATMRWREPTHRHCERSEAIQLFHRKAGLLRRFAPRNDGVTTASS